MKKTVRLLSLVLVLAMSLVFSLAGCNQQDQEAGDAGTTQNDSTQEDTADDSSASSDSEDVANEAPTEFVYALEADIDNFDPFNNQQLTYSKTFGVNVFEPLLAMSPAGGYEPRLATEWKQTSPTEYVFTIREGVTFHNGEPFTAEDVKSTIEFTQDESVTSFYKDTYSIVDSVEVVDATTVKITLSQISNSFLDDLCILRITKAGTEAENAQNPVGTGPYKFVSWSPNDKIVLEKNEEYWNEGLPLIDSLILKPFADKNIAVANLESGDVQFMENLPYSLIEKIESADGLSLYAPEQSNLIYLTEVGLDNVPEFANSDVMEALYLAMDRQTIADTVFYGRAVPSNSVYPSAVKYKTPIDSDYDLTRAKELIDGAGATGMEFDLVVLAGVTELEQIAVIYQASLAQIDVTANIVQCEVAEWLDYYLSRSYDMIFNFYSMGGLDPAIMDNIILKDLVSNVMPNDTKLPQLIADGAAGSSEDERAQIYADIQQYVRDTKVIIPIIQADQLYAGVEGLEGMEINMVGATFLQEVTY